MSAQLKPLFDLQEIDTQILIVEKAIASLDAGATLAAAADQAGQRLAATRKTLHELEIEYRDEDLKLKSFETKRDQHQKKLFSGTIGNPKELDHLRHEIESLTRSKGTIEEKLLGLLDELEARKQEVAAAQQAADASRQAHEAHVADTTARLTHMQEQLVELRHQRAEAVTAVDESLLETYTRLLKKTNQLAIVQVTGTGCPGCGVQLTGFIFRRLREGEDDVNCENCGRILYYPG